MKPHVEEQFEIIRRITDRIKQEMFHNGHEQYLDVMNHLDDEYQWLRAYLSD